MANLSVPLIPDSSNYSGAFGSGVISTKLKGGASRYRADVIGSASNVDVSFVCNSEEYRFISGFYHTVTKEGALPFNIQLIIDDEALKWYEAHFVPGTFKLSDQKGLTYWVSAQLEVKPQRDTSDRYLNEIILQGEYGIGNEDMFIEDSDFLDFVVNYKFPGYKWQKSTS